MGWHNAWSEEDQETLVKLWKEGVTVLNIAKKLKRKRAAVTMYITRHGKRLGLEKRADYNVNFKPRRENFDIAWEGPIPCGHWMITKPWGL
jgi:hypothetical protein